MKKTCSLCGGKLKDGVCTECGMDNRKSDELYKDVLNQSDCMNMKFSHVHENGKAESYQSPKMNQTRKREEEKQKDSVAQKTKNQKAKYESAFQYKSTDTYTQRTFVQNQKQGKKSAGLILTIGFVVVGVIIIMINGMLGDGIASESEVIWNEDFPEDEDFSMDEDSFLDDYDPFAFVEEELNPEGEVWEQELAAGMYVVGIDIPEGEYILTGEEGSSYGVFDREHGLTDRQSFGEEQQIFQAEGVKLFQGALVCVDGFYPVKFSTENAQMQDMGSKEANPLTESYEFSGTAVAGEDFPEGTYDVYALGDDFGIFQFSLDLIRVDYTVPFSFSTLMEKNPTGEYPGYCSVYKNVVLPKGAVLESETLQLQLVPSPEVITTDYISFYDNTY